MRFFALSAAAVLSACGDSGGRIAAPEPFVMFTKDRVTLDHLETPAEAPVAVGSTVSSGVLRSDAPEVVTIDSMGRLVPHRNGRARVSTTSGQSITVDVLAVTSVRIEPEEVELKSGESVDLRVVDTEGATVPAEAVQWFAEPPSILTVRNGAAEALSRGTAFVVARYGGQEARSRVLVRDGPSGQIEIYPVRPALRIGQSVRFEARSGHGIPYCQWHVNGPAVVRQVGPAVFLAQHKGRSNVCATAQGTAVCTTVVVEH